MSKATDDKFWLDLAQAVLKQGEKRPTGKGWRTIPELAKVWKITPSNSSRLATRLTRDGVLEKFRGHTMRGSRVIRCVWYRDARLNKS